MILKQYVGVDVGVVWPLVEKRVQGTLKYAHGELTPDDVRVSCLQGFMQLFIFWEGNEAKSFAITEFVDYPQKRVVRVVVAAGAGYGEFVSEAWGLLTTWAKQNGASAFESWNRPSMTRYLKRFGFKKVYEMTRVELKGD